MCDKASVLFVCFILLICFNYVSILQSLNSTDPLQDLSLFLLLWTFVCYSNDWPITGGFPFVFYLKRYQKRSAVGGETANKIHHRLHLSLKTWHAVFMSEPAAVSGGQPPSRHRNTQESLRGFWYHNVCLHVNLVSGEQAEVSCLT